MEWRSAELVKWLAATRTVSGEYLHCRLDEEDGARNAGLGALRELARAAHQDTVERLAALAAIKLHPLGHAGSALGIAYPDDLHTSTLQGYLGEIVAGLVAVNYEPHGREWEVPAFLFRTHDAAFQALERRRQLGGIARPVPGRTGDDCVAFVRNEDGRIVEWLMCEAKCTHDHDAGLIRKGHEQLSLPLTAPVDLLQLIDILEDSEDLEAPDWVDAIRLMHQESLSGSEAERMDLFMYVCGRRPKNTATWIPDDEPHEAYEAEGPLEAVELHLDDFDDVLEHVYEKHEVRR
jgi:hypothetical protein